ncbi:unnamed protein product [Kuraishia capsulata CBS 1993]|uniref:Polyadenylate-binding protein n=1 Tax=Kuraishia capsulata CBS 1993 TaxID=1382522 RepID=W6MF48_9ASCO|nr:uncharacterized protein KUCA_T00000224001 [Kuraishia capsulata CBS 1993]CDK24264.1 unnamed protein product [Kuraishia capsulata CBS 1993]
MSAVDTNEVTDALEKLNVSEQVESPAAETPATEGEETTESSGSAEEMTSLYVGELDPEVTEADLYEFFSQAGQVSSIRVCRDAITKRSLGYGYVNYQGSKDAERALDELNYHPIKNRACRIMLSQRDPSLRRSGAGNIFIKNLHPDIDNKTLHDTFSVFGTILSCKVVTDEFGSSKGYGFVHFRSDEAAKAAIEGVNGMLLNDRQVYVGPYQPREERASKMDEFVQKFTNVFVKNLDSSVDDAQLEELFKPYGELTSIHLEKDAEGNSRGFGFVNFANHEDATKAVEELNDKEINGKNIYVGRAQKKKERLEELKKQYEALRQEKLNKYQGVNLFVKNLEDTIDDEKLREEFAQFGTITSAKVMTDNNGKSKGFGFVCFSEPEEATKAISEMHQFMVAGKPLYVALAQKKEVRRSQLTQQVQARNQLRMQQTAAGGMGQFVAPIFYGQQPGFLPPGARGGAAPFPGQNPQLLMQQGIPRPGQGFPMQQQFRVGPNGQPIAMMVPQGFNEYQNGRGPQQRFYANNRGQNKGRPQQPQQPQQGEPASLAAILPQVPVEQQKRMLGEVIYQKVAATGKADEDAAGKITGMILDMDNQEILGLLEDDEAFDVQFNEALAAYEDYKNKEAERA